LNINIHLNVQTKVNLAVLLQTIVSSYFRNTIFDVFQQKNRYNSRIQI